MTKKKEREGYHTFSQSNITQGLPPGLIELDLVNKWSEEEVELLRSSLLALGSDLKIEVLIIRDCHSLTSQGFNIKFYKLLYMKNITLKSVSCNAINPSKRSFVRRLEKALECCRTLKYVSVEFTGESKWFIQNHRFLSSTIHVDRVDARDILTSVPGFILFCNTYNTSVSQSLMDLSFHTNTTCGKMNRYLCGKVYKMEEVKELSFGVDHIKNLKQTLGDIKEYFKESSTDLLWYSSYKWIRRA